MLCTNTREVLGLVLGDAVFMKHALIINTIVAMEVLDSNTSQVPTHLFNRVFPITVSPAPILVWHST